MHQAELVKPDGRRLWLYGRGPVTVAPGPAPMPPGERVQPSSHLRWHPLLGEWVINAAHRQTRPMTSAAAANPLAPTVDPGRPTELPAGDWEVAVFENRFPSLAAEPGSPPAVESARVAPATGRAEVIVFAQDEATSLGALDDGRIALVLEVMAERTRAMTAAGVRYVLPFENRGAEMGVTLHHPHGQIYGYGFVPAVQARAVATQREHLARTGTSLVTSLADAERGAGIRLIAQGALAVAFVPPFARFPYETWIVPTRHVPDLAGLSAAERQDLAALLGQSLRRLDGLWRLRMPYLMTVNQAPGDGEPHPEWTLRIEIWPVRRAADKLKFLAGSELAAGVFTGDVSPEAAAAELRAVTA